MTAGREIVSVAIYPSIGVARVGNSPGEFFYGPEVPGAEPIDADRFRDRQGRIKRQAARFRLYGLDASGEVVREITAEDAEITWSVHVANTKAAWFQFDLAMDIPAARGEGGAKATVSVLRNPQVNLGDREQLVIDPGPRTISGAGTNEHGRDREYAFDTGEFAGKPVYLGELRTDEDGRLIFLGGRGLSGSIDDIPVQPGQFANTPGWHDDIADGPVDAVVKIGGRTLHAVGAWVLSAPPDYAPGIPAFVTGYDLIYEVATKLDPSLAPARPKFSAQIYPLLERFSRSQWVNAGFFREFGWGSPMDFSRPELIARLNDPGPQSAAVADGHLRSVPQGGLLGHAGRRLARDLRRGGRLRHHRHGPARLDGRAGDPVRLAPPLGRGGLRGGRPAGPARVGRHDARRAGRRPRPRRARPHDRRPVPPRGRVHLADAPADAVRRPVPRQASPGPRPRPAAPAHLRGRPGLRGAPGRLGAGGPHARWMACPWQTDTSSCLSAYRPYGGEYLPTFWPARVPNDVLTQENYDILVDPARSPAEKERAFNSSRRLRWLRGIKYHDDSYPPTIITDPLPTAVFVDKWWEVGIVTRAAGPGAPFPEEVWVETGRRIPDAGPAGAEPKAAMLLWDEDPTEMR